MKIPASPPEVLGYHVSHGMAGPSRRVRIGAKVIAVALAGVIVACFVEARNKHGGIDDFLPLLTLSCLGITYCVLVAMGLIHRRKRPAGSDEASDEDS